MAEEYKISWDLDGFGDDYDPDGTIRARLADLEERYVASHNQPDPEKLPTEDDKFYPRVLTKAERKEFVKGRYRIECDGGTHEVEGWATKGVLVHKTVAKHASGWTITHQESGISIVKNIPNQMMVFEIAHYLTRCSKWDRPVKEIVADTDARTLAQWAFCLKYKGINRMAEKIHKALVAARKKKTLYEKALVDAKNDESPLVDDQKYTDPVPGFTVPTVKDDKDKKGLKALIACKKRLDTFTYKDDGRAGMHRAQVINGTIYALDGHRVIWMKIDDQIPEGPYMVNERDNNDLKKEFPDVAQVTPLEQPEFHHTFDGPSFVALLELLKAYKKIAVAAGLRHLDGLVACYENNTLCFREDNEDSVSVAGVPHDETFNEEDRDIIGYDFEYLYDALKGCKGKIRIQQNPDDTRCPMRIERPDGETHLVMAMRLG